MAKISGVIIAFNEEKKIERCIKSFKGVVDEGLVVDSNSTDRTKELAQSLGARVIVQEFLGYVEQKNFAMDQANHDWILHLDADEALSEELCEEILKIKSTVGSNNIYAYGFNRLTNYNGFWVRHCGWYPDTKTRLWDRTKGKWGGVNPHDIIKMKNNFSPMKVKGNILHYSYDSISDHVMQTDHFTTIAAKEAYDRGVTSSHFKIMTRPLLKFLKDYFLKRGFLDGRYGFIICFINSLSALLKYSKILELQNEKAI